MWIIEYQVWNIVSSLWMPIIWQGWFFCFCFFCFVLTWGPWHLEVEFHWWVLGGSLKYPENMYLHLCYMCILSGGESSVFKNFLKDDCNPNMVKNHSQKTSVSKTSSSLFECWGQYNEDTNCWAITGSWKVKAPAGHSVQSLSILLPGPA